MNKKLLVGLVIGSIIAVLAIAVPVIYQKLGIPMETTTTVLQFLTAGAGVLGLIKWKQVRRKRKEAAIEKSEQQSKDGQ